MRDEDLFPPSCAMRRRGRPTVLMSHTLRWNLVLVARQLSLILVRVLSPQARPLDSFQDGDAASSPIPASTSINFWLNKSAWAILRTAAVAAAQVDHSSSSTNLKLGLCGQLVTFGKLRQPDF